MLHNLFEFMEKHPEKYDLLINMLHMCRKIKEGKTVHKSGIYLYILVLFSLIAEKKYH